MYTPAESSIFAPLNVQLLHFLGSDCCVPIQTVFPRGALLLLLFVLSRNIAYLTYQIKKKHSLSLFIVIPFLDVDPVVGSPFREIIIIIIGLVVFRLMKMSRGKS